MPKLRKQTTPKKALPQPAKPGDFPENFFGNDLQGPETPITDFTFQRVSVSFIHKKEEAGTHIFFSGDSRAFISDELLADNPESLSIFLNKIFNNTGLALIKIKP